MKSCHHCGRELQLLAKIGRTDGCPFCHSDLKCCLNCRLHDPGANNQCVEPQAEWRFTSPLSQPGAGGAQSETNRARVAFDSLFSRKR